MSDEIYECDINDPRTREHEAYKIAQDNRGRATRRLRYGDNVDARDSPQEEDEEEDEDPASEDDDEDSDGRLDEQLKNAREARGWAVDEANRRYAWNGQWAGGTHKGVEEQADARMEEVTGRGGWNDKIGQLERAIAARDAEPGSSDDDGDDEPDVEEDEDDEQENLWEDRSERERGYRHAQDFNLVTEEGSDDEEEVEDDEEEEEESRSEDDEDVPYAEVADSDSDSD